MEWLLLLPIALAGAGLYMLFAPSAQAGAADFPEDPESESVPVLNTEESPAVMTVHAAPALAKNTAGE